MRTRVYLVDDHEAILKMLEYALPRLMKCEIVGTSQTAAAALKSLVRTKVDVLWIDMCLPELDGPGLLRLLRSRGMEYRSVLCTGISNPGRIREAMHAAPACFVSKGDELSCWRKALDTAARGGRYVSPQIAAAIDHSQDTGLAQLSDMERVVFSLIVRDAPRDYIASLLNISPHTVRHHRERLMTKLNAHSVAELCAIAARTGLLL